MNVASIPSFYKLITRRVLQAQLRRNVAIKNTTTKELREEPRRSTLATATRCCVWRNNMNAVQVLAERLAIAMNAPPSKKKPRRSGAEAMGTSEI
jgi:hypothetical protein